MSVFHALSPYNRGDTQMQLDYALQSLSAHELSYSLSSDNETALCMAARKHSLPIVRQLLLHGAAPNVPSAAGFTPLICAVRRRVDAEGCCRLLLDFGADVNGATDGGWTALHYTSLTGDVDCARLLLSKGADPLQKDLRGKVPREAAEEAQMKELARVLRDAELGSLVMLLLAMFDRERTDTPLARFARHATFDPNLLADVAELLAERPRKFITGWSKGGVEGESV